MWIDGCSGCHMSIFDMDERLLDLADKIELVYSPLVDTKDYPEDVDIVLVEGCVGNEEQREFAHTMRKNTRIFISLGDCAITSNIVAYRNPFTVDEIYEHVFVETSETVQGAKGAAESDLVGGATRPSRDVPALLPYAVPCHEIIDVDVFIPGCPPSADLIHYVLTELLEGRKPDIKNRFG